MRIVNFKETKKSGWWGDGRVRRLVEGTCDPVSQRLLHPETLTGDKTEYCSEGEFCKAPDTNDTSLGECAPKGLIGDHCTSNYGCDRGTIVDAQKISCSMGRGETSGTCGCALDYLSEEERDSQRLRNGFSFRGEDGKGCVKIVESGRRCNAQFDECADSNLNCRPRDGKFGENTCLHDFASQEFENDCLDDSDCAVPFVCLESKCDCPLGMKLDPDQPNTCIPKYVGFLVQCEDNDDCIMDWNIECVSDPNTGHQVCNCSTHYEYFRQSQGQDRCYLTHEFGETCTVDAVLSRHGEEHDCRRKNNREVVTSLLCIDEECACEKEHFVWNQTSEVCEQKYAWFGQACEADSAMLNATVDRYKCDTQLLLECNEKEYKCDCVKDAFLLPIKRQACQLRKLSRHFGEDCSDENALCLTDEFLICRDGKCACVIDPAILTSGKICRFTNTRDLLAGGRRWDPFIYESTFIGILTLSSHFLSLFL